MQSFGIDTFVQEIEMVMLYKKTERLEETYWFVELDTVKMLNEMDSFFPFSPNSYIRCLGCYTYTFSK